MIYLDNAATSGQKPDGVYEAVNSAVKNASGNPGRSGHRISLEAGRLVEQTRLALSGLFNTESAERIVFGLNATDALNTAINGIVKPGDHVITSSMEHNSVARPLEYLKSLGVEVTKVNTSLNDGADVDEIRSSIKSNTSLVVINHISNVTGTVSDAAEIGKVCREAGVPFLLDASQSAGAHPIDVKAMNIDLLAFPGHKSLLGPQGTGALYIRTGINPDPSRRGGTGSRSELLEQPDIMPDRFESGTLNVPGIAGLGAGVEFIMREGIEKIEAKEAGMVETIISGLKEIPGIKIYAPETGKRRGSVMSFTVDGAEPQDISLMLDQAFDIAVRAGLHCAPDAHRSIGTFDGGGTIRVSPGYFTTDDEINAFIEAIREITSAVN